MQKKINAVVVAAAVVVIAVVVAILALTLGRREETYRSIKIIELGGGVTIDREGVGILEASNNMNLISGDSIQTERDAYAVLQLDSDKYVMLAESGRMTVVAEGDEANSKTAIQLEAGSVLNEIQNPLSAGSSYDVVTPNATMSVRGTVFEVRKNNDDGNIEVLVYDGKVAVGLEGKESALYEAGEYTQFTAEENPQFIIERTEITEEVLNQQILERLEQINDQSRELNLGAAQLASAQTTPVPEATAKPVPTASPVPPTPTAVPVTTPTPTTTPTPVKTPQPQVSSAGTVQETPAVTEPEPEDEESDDDDWDWDWDDRWNDDRNNENNHKPENKPENKPQDSIDYAKFWQTYTMAAYEKALAEDTPAGTKCTVVFYLPYITEAAQENDSVKSVLKQDSPGYDFVEVTKGSSLTRPEAPAGYIDNDNGKSLDFVGWCLEDGTMWNFDDDTVKVDVVEANTCLYPVWKEKDSEDTYYYPVLLRSNSEEVWGYYCNNVKVGSHLAAISFENVNNNTFVGWESMNRELEGTYWNFDKDVVEGAESLIAHWEVVGSDPAQE